MIAIASTSFLEQSTLPCALRYQNAFYFLVKIRALLSDLVLAKARNRIAPLINGLYGNVQGIRKVADGTKNLDSVIGFHLGD